MAIHVVDHPCVQHLLCGLREESTPPERFRDWAKVLTRMLVYEATRSVAVMTTEVQTPLERTSGIRLSQGLAAVPILRAGLAMVEAVTESFPDVAVGYIGLERHHETAVAHRYYCKLPDLSGRYTLLLDPMLATGGSAVQAINSLKEAGASQIAMVCVVAAPEGVALLEEHHPDVTIYSASLDRELNELKYILPGLGDFGDRLYGTG